MLTFAVGLKLTLHKGLVVSPTPQYEESSGYNIPSCAKKYAYIAGTHALS